MTPLVLRLRCFRGAYRTATWSGRLILREHNLPEFFKDDTLEKEAVFSLLYGLGYEIEIEHDEEDPRPE